MEITIDDLKYFKLSPTLISLIKCIYSKDNEYFNALNSITNVDQMAKHLEKNLVLKIIGDKLIVDSFEIRNLDIIEYLKNDSSKTKTKDKLIDEVITYFKEVTKQSKISLKSDSNRKFIAGRLNEYSVQDLKDVIDLKFNQWNNDPKMKQYIRIQTLFNETKFQGYIGELENNLNLTKDFNDDI